MPSNVDKDGGDVNPSLPPTTPPTPTTPPPLHQRNFFSRHLFLLWNFAVNLIADFVAAILSRPQVQDSFQQLLLRTITTLLEDPGLVDKLDAATRSYTEDLSRHSDAARQIGKDVPKLVGGFMGGLLSNVVVATRRSGNKKGTDGGGGGVGVGVGVVAPPKARTLSESQSGNPHYHGGAIMTGSNTSAVCDESIEHLYFGTGGAKKDE